MNTSRQVLANAEISCRIVAKMNDGLALPEAFDAVMGQGAYLKLAGEVYAALRT